MPARGRRAAIRGWSAAPWPARRRRRSAPAVVGHPGRRGAELQQGRLACAVSHDDQVVLLHALAAAVSAQRDQVPARGPVRGKLELQRHRPAASAHRAVPRCLVMHSAQAGPLAHRNVLGAVASDLDVVALGRRADAHGDRLARCVAEAIGVAPDLQDVRIARRSDVVVVEDVRRPALRARHRIGTRRDGTRGLGAAHREVSRAVAANGARESGEEIDGVTRSMEPELTAAAARLGSAGGRKPPASSSRSTAGRVATRNRSPAIVRSGSTGESPGMGS